jgi:arylsulfatase
VTELGRDGVDKSREQPDLLLAPRGEIGFPRGDQSFPRRPYTGDAGGILRDIHVEAAKYNVLPLANDFMVRMLTPRPNLTVGRDVFTYAGESSGLEVSGGPDPINKSYTITAEIEVPQGGGGMPVTLGGRFGGYGLYLLKGKPVFTYNLMDLGRFRWEGPQALAPGKHTVVSDFKRDDGPGFGKGGTGILKVVGQNVATKTVPHIIPLTATAGETFDVSVDTSTSVDDRDYKPPFLFNGKSIS